MSTPVAPVASEEPLEMQQQLITAAHTYCETQDGYAGAYEASLNGFFAGARYAKSIAPVASEPVAKALKGIINYAQATIQTNSLDLSDWRADMGAIIDHAKEAFAKPVAPVASEPGSQVHVDENGYRTEDPWTDADIDNLLEALEREPGDEQFAADAITVIKQLRQVASVASEQPTETPEDRVARIKRRWAAGFGPVATTPIEMLEFLHDRFRMGVGQAVAESYAEDIEMILAAVAPVASEPVAKVVRGAYGVGYLEPIGQFMLPLGSFVYAHPPVAPVASEPVLQAAKKVLAVTDGDGVLEEWDQLRVALEELRAATTSEAPQS